MFYGVILESAREAVILFHGQHIWRRIVEELQFPSDKFNSFDRYDSRILLNICECKTKSCFFFLIKTTECLFE